MDTTNWPTLWNGFKEDPRLQFARSQRRCGSFEVEEYTLEETGNGSWISSPSHPICQETTDLGMVERLWAELKTQPRNRRAIFKRANHKAKTIILETPTD